jgi:hypothetical protein
MTLNRILGAALALAVPAALSVLVLTPTAAQARWYGGVVVGVPYPYVVPPPVYYPPPVYAAPVYPAPVYPAPAYSAPANTSAPPPPGQVCSAGSYVCPLDRPTPSGDSCSCPTGGGRAWGRAQ